MRIALKLTIAGLVAALTATWGVAAPGGVAPVVSAGDHVCC